MLLHRDLRANRLTAIRALLVIGFACASAAIERPVWSVSTETVSNDRYVQTRNPIDTSHPIYYPIKTDVEVAGGEYTTPENLLRQFMDRHTRMDYPGAVEAALQLAAVVPDRPEGYYNLACALAKVHRVDEAIAALDKSIDCGWRELSHTSLDPDMLSIRDTDGFRRSVSRIRAAIEAERVPSVALRTDPWPQAVDEVKQQATAVLARFHVPGVSVALVRDGETVWTGALGLRDRRRTDLMQSSDVFRIRAPLHLLALVAGRQQQDEGRVVMVNLLAQAADLDGGPRVIPVRESSGKGQSQRSGSRSPASATIGTDTRTVGESVSSSRGTRRPGGYAKASVFGLLRLAVEHSSGESFPEYCQSHILSPTRMMASGFKRPTTEAAITVIGHSAMGTPMEPDPKSDESAVGGALFSTADDLALLIESAMQESSASTIDLLGQVEQTIHCGLGLNVNVRNTPHGRCVQVADTSSGMGCLMRWYPASRCGVVVLYNSDTGLQAAERIAHLALGGD